jgi:PKD repeat protein
VLIEVHKLREAHKRRGFNSTSEPVDGSRVFVDHVVRGYSIDELDSRRSMPQMGKTKDANRVSTESSFGGDASIENSCGTSERLDTVCWAGSDPAAYDRSGPVAKILVGTSACTAWRVGPDNLMFTNNHCINSKSLVSATEVWFNYEKSVCGGSGTEPVVKVAGDQLLSTDQTLDYTLFTVKDFNLIEPFGNLGLEVREAVLGEEIYIPQHGAGDPKQLSVESDMNIGGVCRVDAESHDGLDVGTDVGYYCDTAGGSSGSPVILAGSNKAIALHHHGGCLNSGVKMSLIWPKVKRHFKRVIPEGDYSGPPSNSAPTASFSFACTSLSCSFNGSGSSDSDGSIVDYSWDFADGFSASGAGVNHSYASEGTYGVTLTVTDNDGLTRSMTQQVGLVSGSGSQLELSVAGGKAKGMKWADLSWSGSATSQVKVYRNGDTLAVTENFGSFRDQSLSKNTKSARYKVCEYTGSTCSSEVSVNF